VKRSERLVLRARIIDVLFRLSIRSLNLLVLLDQAKRTNACPARTTLNSVAELSDYTPDVLEGINSSFKAG
jgi:hypothetical protein